MIWHNFFQSSYPPQDRLHFCLPLNGLRLGGMCEEAGGWDMHPCSVTVFLSNASSFLLVGGPAKPSTGCSLAPWAPGDMAAQWLTHHTLGLFHWVVRIIFDVCPVSSDYTQPAPLPGRPSGDAAGTGPSPAVASWFCKITSMRRVFSHLAQWFWMFWKKSVRDLKYHQWA